MITQLTLRDFCRAVSDLVLPCRCIVCGTRLALRERHLCLRCLADLPRTFFSSMPRNQMADRFNELIQRDLDASGGFYEYSLAASLFYYRSSTGYRLITQRLKYHADIAAGRFFSGMLAEEMAASPLYSDVDAVIPVPLHWTRRWSRGYNQAEIIAKVVSGRLHSAMRTDILYRTRRTRTQTKMSIGEKSLNVSHAFGVRSGVCTEGISHILIVDDVFTTGATLHSCYLALREVFPSSVRISVATLACVGR
jgi:Predicted amidophosphoribosyltransferases